MRINDRKTRPWLIGSAVMLLAAMAGFLVYAGHGLRGPRGGSWPGLMYAALGSAMIVAAMLLSLRKQFRAARVGRAYLWMQAHVWLGALSYPMILMHAGPHWGGPLTLWLMWLFTVIFISGVVGLTLQQFLPATLTKAVPAETIFDQIDRVVAGLREEAEKLVATAAARVEVGAGESAAAAPAGPAGGGAQALLAPFYEQQIRPLLQPRIQRRLALARRDRADAEFRALRGRLPAALHETLDDLTAIVDERRQLETQRRLHRLLHWWLLAHVPLSFAMIPWAAVHAVAALRYATLGGW